MRSSSCIFVNGEKRRPDEARSSTDLASSGYDLGEKGNHNLRNRYKRLCKLLDISINEEYSKKELEAQDKVNQLDKDELFKLMNYIQQIINEN